MLQSFNVKAANGIVFCVRVVRQGEEYGTMPLVNAHAPTLVEFYDTRFDWTPYGQFIGRYFLSTLTPGDGGLCLDGGVPHWTIDADAMAVVRGILRQYA